MAGKRGIATLFGVGLLPKAPGTWGSAVSAILAYPILLAPYGWAILLGLVFWAIYLGTIASERYMKGHETDHDPSEIIVDELAGQWLTFSIWHLWLLFMTTSVEMKGTLNMMQEVGHSPVFLFIGFLLFRFFDIVKPWPISWADKNTKGGFGVMLDDLLAAIPAGSILYAMYLFHPIVFGGVESSI